MKLYSTRHSSPEVNFENAVFQGLPPDNGLYMPEAISLLSSDFWSNVENLSFNEIAYEVSRAFLSGEISDSKLREIITSAFDFEAPVVRLTEGLYCLELFHGPSMAFKDFGARFMAAVMSHFLEKSGKKLNILVATSGDTGGAVAQGFYKVPGINVTILYPKGKVSDIQEKQLTTLGGNIHALEVDGTFDDCQALVKKAFLDETLRKKYQLASANSINIARLIPQSFYYISAYAQVKSLGKNIVFSVPSGNFGNLTAGVMAMRMGMPVKKFIAATNSNQVVPDYLETGKYKPVSPSIATISNAMDVGNPSNFPRLLELFHNDLEEMRTGLKGCHYDDDQTRKGILELQEKYNYPACPHTAVAYLGLKDYGINQDEVGVFLSTAHYGKFLPEMEKTLGFVPEIPGRLILSGEKKAQAMSTEYADFKVYLEDNLI